MSSTGEYISLLSSHHSRISMCPFLYRFQFIHSKGALLVLFWDLMIGVSVNIVSLVVINPAFEVYTLMAIGLLYLLFGAIGDTCVKRYHLIVAGSYVMFTCIILISLFLLVIDQYLITSAVINYIVYGLFLIQIIASASVRVNLLPFNIDQLIGSSSDELSAVIHWHTLGPFIGLLFWAVIVFFVENILIVNVAYLSISLVCITAVLVTHSLLKHWLDTVPQFFTNPFKLIFRVLHYARIHKYPENRSALTYWEEEAPSRLDLGKEKYGGPFTEEEVENVKTVFRLLPLFVCVIASSFNNTLVNGVEKAYGCLNDLKEGIMAGSCVILIFLYQFLIFPCFSKYIPSMLKRVGMGLVVVLIALVYYIVIILIIYFSDNHTSCIILVQVFESNEGLLYKWQILPNILQGFINYFFYVTFLEFVLAQSPKEMRGTFFGLWFCIYQSSVFIKAIIFLPFHYFMSSSVLIGRGFYFFLSKAVITFLLLLVFVYIAKRYKYRVRENEVPIHRIVEDHYIRYMDQEKEFWRGIESDQYSMSK